MSGRVEAAANATAAIVSNKPLRNLGSFGDLEDLGFNV